MRRTIGVILAGGGSERMGGADKARAELNGRRLVDLVYARLAQQVARVIISGREGYGLGVPFVRDDPALPGGPAGGVFSAAAWVRENDPHTHGILTAPVDGPALPDDLAERLAGEGSAVASAPDGAHATFAYWRLADLDAAAAALGARASVSLRDIAAAARAREVCWPDAKPFANINHPDDLMRARREETR